MERVLAKLSKNLIFLLLFVLGVLTAPGVYAQSITEFIALPTFPTHTLSTGEVISYSSEGGGPQAPVPGSAIPVRQYKNSNWEQFFVDASGIYRREDTSWQVQGHDPVCSSSLNRAYFAMDGGSCTNYSDGQTMASGGAQWLPNFNASSSVGQSPATAPHQIFTADAGVPPGTYSGMDDSLRYCSLSPPDTNYNNGATCGTVATLTITGYYEAGEYEFCSGVTNPAPVVTFAGTGGAGAGDGFAYMQGCGLAGFDDGNFKVGIVDGCGIDPSQVDASNCSTPDNVQGQDVPIIFYGQVRTKLPTLDATGDLISESPVRGAAIALYEGTTEVDSGNFYGLLDKYAEVATDGNGTYVIEGVRRAFGKSHDNAIWMYIWCGTDLVLHQQLDLSQEIRRKDISVGCPSNNYDPPPKPPNQVQLNAMGDALMCSAGDERNYDSYLDREIGPGMSIPIPLLREDVDDSFLGCNDYSPTGCLPDAPVYTTTEELLGRNDLSRISGTFDDVVFQIMGSYGYGKTDPLLKNAEPYNEDEQCYVDVLDNCEDVRLANSTLTKEGDPARRSTAQMYNIGSTLSHPGQWEKLYEQADPQKCVCKDLSNEPVRLCEIQPPNNFSYDNRQPQCGDFRFTADYFPFLKLIGEEFSGSTTKGLYKGELDSYVESDVLEAARQDKFTDSFLANLLETEKPYVTHEQTFKLGGRAEFSPHSVQFLTDTTIAREQGFSSPIGGVMSDPSGVFGYDSSTGAYHPSLDAARTEDTNSNILQIGRGDFERLPYEMCTCNVNDPTCTDEFNTFTASDERHDWTGTYRYLTEAGINANILQVSFLEAVCRLILTAFGLDWTELNACTIATASDKERIDLGPYGGAAVPAQGELVGQVEGATKLDLDPDNPGRFLTPNPTCIPMAFEPTDTPCWNNPDGFECRASCVAPDPGTGDFTSCSNLDAGCSDDATCGPNADPPPQCAALGYSCSYQIKSGYDSAGYGRGEWEGNSACIGDLRADFAATDLMFKNAHFNQAPFMAALQTALMLHPPFEPISVSGFAATHDQPVMWEDAQPVGRATQAFKATGPGAATVYTGFTMFPVADPVFKNDLPAPEWGAPLPEPNPFGNAGDPNDPGDPGGPIGNGTCSPAPEGSPCSVSNLMNYFPTEQTARIASTICNKESSGNPRALNNSCDVDVNFTRRTYDYSVGLFQINLIDDRDGELPNLPSAGGYGRCAAVGVTGAYAQAISSSPPLCRKVGALGDSSSQAGDNTCVGKYFDPEVSINWAVRAAGCNPDGGGCNWGAWSAARACGII